MSGVIEMADVSKSFTIPSVRRETVREHALDLFRRVPEGTAPGAGERHLRASARRKPGTHGPQRQRKEHAPEDRLGDLYTRHR